MSTVYLKDGTKHQGRVRATAPAKTFVVVWRPDGGDEETFYYSGRRMVADETIIRKLQKHNALYCEVYIIQHEQVPTNPLPFKELWK